MGCVAPAVPSKLGWVPRHCWRNEWSPHCFCCSFVLSATHQTGGNGQGISIYIPWPFPPVWGVADNTKETNKNKKTNKQTKTMGVSLRSSSNDEGSSRVWMALLEQHNPPSPVFHNLRRFIDAVSPTATTTGLPLQGNPVATADANQNCVTIIRHSFLFLARSLASLISILLSFRALFTPSIHPNLGLPLVFVSQKPIHPSPSYQTYIQSHSFCSLLNYTHAHSTTPQLEFGERLISPPLPFFHAVSEENSTEEGIPSPLAPSLLVAFYDTQRIRWCYSLLYAQHHRAYR